MNMDPDLKAAEDLCIETASGHGYNRSQARNCDDFSLGCLDCPFAITKEDRAKLQDNGANNATHPVQ